MRNIPNIITVSVKVLKSRLKVVNSLIKDYTDEWIKLQEGIIELESTIRVLEKRKKNDKN